MGLDNFRYDAEHQVIVCQLCGTCLVPKATSWSNHLRAEPHRMRGDELKATTQFLSGYKLRSVDELRESRPSRSKPCRPIKGLTVLSGYRCVCNTGTCDYSTCRLARINENSSYHGESIPQGGFEKYGHYTQVMWKSTTKVGIASASDGKGGYYTFARYAPSGNSVGQKPF